MRENPHQGRILHSSTPSYPIFKALWLGMVLIVTGLCLGGCLVFSVVQVAGDVTTSAVKTTGSVAVATVKAGGSVVAAGVSTAVSLAKTGAIVVLDSGSGAVWEMPWARGMAMSAAMGVTKTGAAGLSGKLVRKSKEISVPRDRWAKTYLESGDVVIVGEPTKR